MQNLDELPAFRGWGYAGKSGQPAHLPGKNYRKSLDMQLDMLH
jgi:hypothetical protein